MVATQDPRAPAGLRLLLWGRGVSAVGDGLWFTVWAVYFTRVVHLSTAAVGIGMAVAGACGMAAAVPLGALADRLGPRGVLVVVTVIRTVAMAGYLAVRDPWTFTVVSVAFTAFANGGTAVRTALVTALVTGNEARMSALGRQRVVQHVGYAAGAGAGALVLSADRPGVYLAAIVANAVTFAILAVLTAAVPATERAAHERRPRGCPVGRDRRPLSARLAVSDRPYLSVMAASSVLALCWAMLSTGLPIWISHDTRLPLSLSGAVVVIGSAGIAALQLPAGRLARTATAAARTSVRAGVALAAACVLLAGTGGRSGPVAAAVVISAGLLHLAGELGFVAASWGLSVTLMREEARGAYQGVSEAATATVQMAAPAVFTLALGTFGAGGWLIVAGVFLSASAPVPALARWALRTR